MTLLRKTKNELYANLDGKKTLPMIIFWKTIKPISCKLTKPQFDKKKNSNGHHANSYAIPQQNSAGSQS